MLLTFYRISSSILRQNEVAGFNTADFIAHVAEGASSMDNGESLYIGFWSVGKTQRCSSN